MFCGYLIGEKNPPDPLHNEGELKKSLIPINAEYSSCLPQYFFICLSMIFQEAWRTETFKRAFIFAMHASGSGGMWGPAGRDANHAEISSSLQQQEALFSHFC